MGLLRMLLGPTFAEAAADRQADRIAALIRRARWVASTRPPRPPPRPPAPAGLCDPGCPGWAPFDDSDRIQRCDECARAAGVADTYTDALAEEDAAAWAAAVIYDGPVCKWDYPHDIGEVVEALHNTPGGRWALARAIEHSVRTVVGAYADREEF